MSSHRADGICGIFKIYKMSHINKYDILFGVSRYLCYFTTFANSVNIHEAHNMYEQAYKYFDIQIQCQK